MKPNKLNYLELVKDINKLADSDFGLDMELKLRVYKGLWTANTIIKYHLLAGNTRTVLGIPKLFGHNNTPTYCVANAGLWYEY